MFEIDEEIDIDDEFLNVVFENEERDNNNEPTRTGKSNNASSSINLNKLSASRNCIITQDSFQARHNVCSDSKPSQNHLTGFRRINNTHQTDSSRSVTPAVPCAAIDPPGDGKGHNLGNTSFGNKENKRKQASSPPSKSKRERRFPGPAGLLPDWKSSRGTPLKFNQLQEVESPSASTPEELCSQGRLSGSVLEEEPWQNLIADLGPHADVLDIVNVASVKRKAAARCFVGRKVPFLAAVLHHLDVSSADPCIILRDRTGEIHGTLHREVWQRFATELVVGSVLVIRNVGLLSTGISSRRHYLNITANNLATIYTVNPEKAQKRELHSLTSQDVVRTIEHWRSLVTPQQTTGSPASLFNTSLSSSCSSSPRLNDLKYPSKLHPTNTRATTSQTNEAPRPTGKNLFPSFSIENNSTRLLNSNVKCNLSSASNLLYNAREGNPSLSRNILNNSISSLPVQKTKQIPALNSFINQSTPLKGSESNPVNNILRIVSSQASQLTVEEQSVIENVFDGIDADSLFDDDF